MMQLYKYKRNLIDTDLIDYYHIIYTPRTKNMHYTDYTKHLEVDSAWPVYDEARAIFGPPGICKLEALEL